MSKFNRSQFVKNQHKQARIQREFYEELTGNKGKYQDFMKNETPLDDQVVVYDVSYQMTYMSNNNNFSVESPQTFRVYALNGQYTQENIVQNTIEAVKNMKSPNTGSGLNVGLQRTIDRDLDVQTSKVPLPRGFEKNSDVKLNKDIIDSVKNSNGFYVETLDSNVQISGGKRRSSNTAYMNVDLTRYIE